MPVANLSVSIIPPNTTGEMLIPVLNDRIRKLQLMIGQSGSHGSVLYGSHAKRLGLKPAQNAGTIFYEVDRGYLSYLSDGNNWHFAGGSYSGSFGQRPSNLGPFDAGLEFFVSVPVSTYPWAGFSEMWNGSGWVYVSGEAQASYAALTSMAVVLTASEIGLIVAESTYLHRYQWQGSAWAYANGDTSQYTVEADQMPSGGIWYPCDGGSKTCSIATGTSTRSVSTQNWNNGATVAAAMSGGFAQTINAATPMTFSSGTGSTLASGSNLKPNAPSVANGGLAQYYTVSKWLRA